MQNLSIITTHYKDFTWINVWLNRLTMYTETSRIKELLIINQDRDFKSRKRLERLSDRVRVLEYPKSDKHIYKQGHDHAYVLNRAIHEATGDFLCIFDSDCHPNSYKWIEYCENLLKEYDAITALDSYALKHRSLSLSHPCFMVLRRDHLDLPLLFDEGLFEENYDTGRLIGKQLTERNQSVFFAPPEKAFNGYWGSVYLNSIYHHEKGSYQWGEDRLKKQVDWRQNFFKYVVTKRNRYYLNQIELNYFQLRHLKKGFLFRIPNQLIRISSALIKKIRQYY